MQIKGFFCILLWFWWVVVPLRAFAQYSDDLRDTISELSAQAHEDFEQEFAQAHESYPPKKLALLVFKAEKIIELWAGHGKRWVYISELEVLAASGGPGPKLRNGDRQVPEGIYKITMLNPYSKFDVSLRINYPDEFDRVQACIDHRKDLGGDIYIHGGQRSIGCLAIGDRAVEDLFVLVYEVGMSNVTVIIAPNDLRRNPPLLAKHAPKWVHRLHQKLKTALAVFQVREQDVHHT